MADDIRYCTTSDGIRIAYCLKRGGSPTIVIANNHPFGGLREYGTYIPHLIDALVPRHSVVWYDGRGHGYSQREADDFSFPTRLLDLEAVIEASAATDIVLVGTAQSAATCIAYAAERPERMSGLIVWSVSLEGRTQYNTSEMRGIVALAQHDWNLFLETYAHLITGWSEDESKRVAENWREVVTREVATRYYLASREVDLRPMISRIQAPTLVMHTAGVRLVAEEDARALAAELPRGGLRIVQGIGIGAQAADAARHMREFIAEVSGGADSSGTSDRGRGLRTVLFTDLVGHTEMMRRLGDDRGRNVLREHERITRGLLREHGGTEVKTMGDGFMASFTSVTKAVDCAIALQRAFASHEGEPLQIRVGLNAGEPIEEDGDLFGSTVIMASRIAAKAGAGEILIPEPLRHLLTGKSYVYADRGEALLKGFEDAVRLYEVRWRTDPRP